MITRAHECSRTREFYYTFGSFATDSHTYVRTPTHKQPVTDYVGVREKASSQKRDVERALTRFIAKTGKTHSLFRTDDTNLFPLISCDRLMPDQPALPAYLNALLFKDQV